MASDVEVTGKADAQSPVAGPSKTAKEPIIAQRGVPSMPQISEAKALPAPVTRLNGAGAKPSAAQPKKAAKAPSPKKVAGNVAKGAAKPDRAATPVTFKAAQPAEALRGVAEQSLVQARTAFAKSQEATQRLAKGFEASGEVVQSGVKEMQLRMAEALEAQTHAAFNYFRAITKAHSFSDLIDVQATEMRLGVQRTLGEAKEISSLAQAIAAKATEPVRKAIDLAVDQARHSR